MTLIRSGLVAVPLALSLMAVAAGELGAQQRTLFTWSGEIDREVVLVMRGRNVETRASGVDATIRPRLAVREALPRSSGEISLHLSDGRGTFEVLEQPSARNNYSTVLRIRDPRAGRAAYRIVASWRPGASDGRGGAYPDDRRGRDDDRRDDRGARDRDDDRWDDRNRGRNDDRWDDRNTRGNANGRRNAGMLRWSGDVDDVSEIRISGRRVEYRTRSGAPIRNARVDLRGNGLPRQELRLALDVARGRGRVEIVQQPRRSNNYTAIVRITDPRSGYGLYDFDLTW
jgi:hypothetical protein